jgi:ribosome maturation factor RimP
MNEERTRQLTEAEQFAREIAASLGLEVVEFIFHSQGRHSLLRIDVDRPGPAGVALADCERLSRALDERLDALSFFDAAYELQVSSPGIDRPIRSDDDLRRNSGRQVRVEYRDEAGKVRDASGTLLSTSSESVVQLAGVTGTVSISREAIILMKQEVTAAGRKREKS